VNEVYRSPEGEKIIMALYDEALARWPVPSQAQHVPTRHGETFVIACGDPNAPPLVLLHGSGTNSAALAPDGRRAILRGIGREVGCPGGASDIAREAIDIGAKVLWAQLGVCNDEAARLAEAAGLKVVMNRCPKIELFRPFWKPRLNQAI